MGDNGPQPTNETASQSGSRWGHTDTEKEAPCGNQAGFSLMKMPEGTELPVRSVIDWSRIKVTDADCDP